MNKTQAAKQYPNASGAGMLGNNPKFWRFVEMMEPGVQVRSREDARDWIYAHLDISSRKELDENPECKAAWGRVITEFNQFLENGFQKIPKQTTWECPELLAIASFAPCMRCGKHQGTGKVVGCHAQGFWATKYGKGWAQKPSDFVVAYLCNDCHRLMDAYENAETEELRSLEWAALIFRTFEWLFQHGFLIPINRVKSPECFT
mgnify:CR=1 FL=1